MDAYLDIETSYGFSITVIGVFREFRQLVGSKVNRTNLLKLLEGVTCLVTYNGNRFDLCVTRKNLCLDLAEHFESYDLMYACWKKNLYGGLKKVERRLGISRELEGGDGREAMVLWRRYEAGDSEALAKLLFYNREDVLNLVKVRKRLEEGIGA